MLTFLSKEGHAQQLLHPPAVLFEGGQRLPQNQRHTPLPRVWHRLRVAGVHDEGGEGRRAGCKCGPFKKCYSMFLNPLTN